MDPRVWLQTPEYKLLAPPADLASILTPQELARGSDAFILVSGKGAAGKSRLLSRIEALFPKALRIRGEASTRPLRPGERLGRDVVPYSSADFEAAIAEGTHFLWAFEVPCRNKRAAFQIAAVRAAIDDFHQTGQRTLITSAAPVYFVLLHFFPGTRLIVVTTTPEDMRANQQDRGLDPSDNATQNDYGITSPGFEIRGAQMVVNRRDQPGSFARTDQLARTLYRWISGSTKKSAP